ncbi:MAG: glycosyl hydrolase [Polyangiaceae bacterium]
MNNVLTQGTAEYTSFVGKLDYAAAELKKLQDANVAVIWAPFHEVQANGWFWWSKGTGAQFVSLWKFMFDYFTNTKKLNNLVWLMPFSGTPSAAYYPGKAYLDISGPDTYETNQPFTAMYSTSRGIIGTSVPIPLHETGLIPNPANMFPSAAPWVLFNIWAGYQKDGTHNTTANIQSIYNNSYVVTRDEVPNLK